MNESLKAVHEALQNAQYRTDIQAMMAEALKSSSLLKLRLGAYSESIAACLATSASMRSALIASEQLMQFDNIIMAAADRYRVLSAENKSGAGLIQVVRRVQGL